MHCNTTNCFAVAQNTKMGYFVARMMVIPVPISGNYKFGSSGRMFSTSSQDKFRKEAFWIEIGDLYLFRLITEAATRGAV